jgi:hypothetical protein
MVYLTDVYTYTLHVQVLMLLTLRLVQTPLTLRLLLRLVLVLKVVLKVTTDASSHSVHI